MNIFYIIPIDYLGSHIGVSKQTRALRRFAKLNKIPFSLPIVEWAIPGVYYRLFENITLAQNSTIFVMYNNMLPVSKKEFRKVLTSYLEAYCVNIVCLSIKGVTPDGLGHQRWIYQDDGSYKLKTDVTNVLDMSY